MAKDKSEKKDKKKKEHKEETADVSGADVSFAVAEMDVDDSAVRWTACLDKPSLANLCSFHYESQ